MLPVWNPWEVVSDGEDWANAFSKSPCCDAKIKGILNQPENLIVGLCEKCGQRCAEYSPINKLARKIQERVA